jgi:hypothetical protein
MSAVSQYCDGFFCLPALGGVAQVVVAVEHEQIAAAPLALHRMPRRQLVARQPVRLAGGEFVDQGAQLAPGHASEVRVDRLQAAARSSRSARNQ